MEASITPSLLTPTTATTATPTISTPPSTQYPPPSDPQPQTNPSPTKPTTFAQPPTQPTSTTLQPASSSTFTFPPHHSFPPFYTLQPNTTTLSRQLSLWSSLLLSYAASTSLFTLSLSTAPLLPLFTNKTISRSLDERSIRAVLSYMALPENGRRVEWLSSSSASSSSTTSSVYTTAFAGRERDRERGGAASVAWIWWRTPEEWGEEIYAWVDATGQKGSVLTLYELRESEAVARQAWVGMDEGMFRRCLETVVRKGRAQVFEGQGGDGAGVKFF